MKGLVIANWFIKKNIGVLVGSHVNIITRVTDKAIRIWDSATSKLVWIPKTVLSCESGVEEAIQELLARFQASGRTEDGLIANANIQRREERRYGQAYGKIIGG